MLRLSPRARIWAGAGWMALIGGLTLPNPPFDAPLASVLDDSWLIGLTMARRMGLHWGSQVIFTYGPYADLMPQHAWFAGQYLAALATAVAVHALFLLALGLYLFQTGAGPGQWALTGILLVPNTFFPSIELEGVAASLLLAALALRVGGRGALVAAAGAGAVLAFVALYKSTAVASGGGIVATGALLGLAGRRAVAAALPAAFVATFLGLWLAAGQALADLPAHFLSLFQLVVGYGPAVALLPLDPATLAAAAMTAGLLLLVPLAAALRAWAMFRLAAMAAPVVFVFFREGFVRYDRGHAFLALSAILLMLGLLLLESTRMPRPAARWLASLPLAGLAALLAAMIAAVHPGPLSILPQQVHLYGAALQAVADPTARTRLEAVQQSELRDHYRLPPEALDRLRTGTVDVIPWDIAAIYAYDLRWAPRPVLQSYAAYTVSLDAADAVYFKSTAAPDHVLFVFESIDGRYPLDDEPLAVRALLERYRTVYTFPDGAVLERRAQPLDLPPRVESRLCAAAGAPVAVPQLPGRYVYAQIDAPTSLFGRLEGALLRVLPPSVHRLRADGVEVPESRLVPASGSSGVLVSAYPTSAAEVGDLFRGLAVHPVTAISAGAGGRAYTGRTCYTFLSTPSPPLDSG